MSKPVIILKGETLENVPALEVFDPLDNPVDFYYTGDATAQRGDVVQGKIFYGPNGETTGSLYVNDDKSYVGGYDWSSGNDVVISAGTDMVMRRIHLAPPANLTPEYIKSGITICGVTGTYSGGVTPTYTVTDVSESDVISGKSFYKATTTSSVTRSTGTMPTFSGTHNSTPIISSAPSYIGVQVGTPGYYTNQAKLVCSYGDMANAIGLTSTIIKNGETVLGVTGSYSPSLTPKSITSNGTYTASSEGYDGYSSVVVNVSGGFNIDLTGTTWVLNSVISLNPYYLFSICFEDDYSHNNWLALDIDSDSKSSSLQYKDGKSDTTVYINNSWVNNGYKTITITGGSDVSNPYLVAWLLQNATKQ